MSKNLTARIRCRKDSATNQEYYEATVTVDRLNPTKFTKTDRSTQFPNRSSLVTSLRTWAKSHGYADVDLGETTEAAKTTKKAAKKSATKTTKSKK